MWMRPLVLFSGLFLLALGIAAVSCFGNSSGSRASGTGTVAAVAPLSGKTLATGTAPTGGSEGSENTDVGADLPAVEGPFASLGGPSPFGLGRGSSLEDVERALGLLSPVSDSDYMAVEIPGDPPLLQTLTLTITPQDGLCRLRASTSLLQDPGDGSIVLDAFERLRAPLETVFGDQQTILDTLLPDSPYADEDQWLAGLRRRHRAKLLLWNRESGSRLPETLAHVSLSARAYSDVEGFIVVEYSFTNWAACEARMAADRAIE